jgi:hypothetical protein
MIRGGNDGKVNLKSISMEEGNIMRTVCISALFMVLLMCLSCAAPRYSTYKPTDGGSEWKVMAEKAANGWVTVTINGEVALKGQYSFFPGEKEAKGSYQGHDIRMVLMKHDEGRTTIFECLLYAENHQIGNFNWRLP